MEDAFEDPVEVGQRLETHFISDFTHPQVRIQQQFLGLFGAEAGNVLREAHTGVAFEELAEIKQTRVNRRGHLTERQIIPVMILDVALGPRDDRRLGTGLLDGDLVALDGEMIGKYSEQGSHGFHRRTGHHWRSKIGLPDPGSIYVDTHSMSFFDRLAEASGCWFIEEHLTGLKISDGLIAQPNGHGRLTESVATRHRARRLSGRIGQPSLHLETGRTRPTLLGRDGAEWVFPRFTVQG